MTPSLHGYLSALSIEKLMLYHLYTRRTLQCLSSHCWQTQPPLLPGTLLERGPRQLLRQEPACVATTPML